MTRMEAINTDLDSPEKYIVVDTWAELDELRILTLAFSTGYSDKAQWPPFDQIPKAYCENSPDGEPQGDINWSFPFGHRTDPDTFITALRNTVLLSANQAEERNKVACLALQGVKDVDGSEALITFGYSGSDPQDCFHKGLAGAMGEGDDGSTAGEFAMPAYKFGSLNNMNIKWVEVQKASADRLGLNREGVLDPVVKELVIKWLSTGIFPEELRELVFASIVKMYY